MHTSTFDSALTRLAIASISSYQKYLSPHKGFSCAHRLLYGEESCSQYFKRLIAEEGLFIAVKASKGRFQECREANYILKASRNPQNHICRATKNSPNSIFAVNENPDLTEPEEGDSEDKEVSPEGTDKTGQPQNQGLEQIGDFCDCSGNACLVFDGCSSSGEACSVLSCGGLEALDCSALDCGALDCSAIGDCGSCGS